MSEYGNTHEHHEQYYEKSDTEITSSVFLIIGLCAGLPALIWAVRSLHQLQGRGVRVSVFIVSLLFSDALELLSSPVVIAVLLKPNAVFSRHLMYASVATRLNGYFLHQLVALEGVLSHRNPRCSSCLSSPFFSIPLSITLWMFAFNVCVLEIFMGLILLCELICVIAVVMCLLACKSTHSHSNTCMKPSIHVAVVAVVTLVFLYGPYIVNGIFFSGYWLITASFIRLRLIADPVLCVLVCRKIILATITNTDRTAQRSV